MHWKSQSKEKLTMSFEALMTELCALTFRSGEEMLENVGNSTVMLELLL